MPDQELEQYVDGLVENMERVVSDAVALMPNPPLWSTDFQQELVAEMTRAAWGSLKIAFLSHAQGTIAATLMP